MENIRPSADLRNRYGELSKICRETRQPISITVNGRGDTVLMNLAAYNQQMAELELLKALAEGDSDIQNGRIGSMQESFDRLRADLNSRSRLK